MPFLDSVQLRHQGPKSDLSVAYLSCTINAAAQPVVDATKTTAGYTITGTAGVYVVTVKRSRFIQVHATWLPLNAAGDRSVRVLGPINPSPTEPTLAQFTIEISASLNGAAASPAAAANQLELLILNGF